MDFFNSKAVPYLFFSFFIFIWWGFAFQILNPPLTSFQKLPFISSSSIENSPLSDLLSPLNRNLILQALSGDTSLMVQMMETWYVDGKRMQKNGMQALLDEEEILKVRKLEKMIKRKKSLKKIYLPQSFTSAAFLLYFLEENQIAAIPDGLRHLHYLFPKKELNKIPLTINRYHTENFVKKKPQAAFIANFSDQNQVEILMHQKIPIFCLNDIKTMEGIYETALSLGEILDEKEKASLLTLFLKTCMETIDQRLQFLKKKKEKRPFLYLQYFHEFTLPTKKTLSGYFLQRMGEFFPPAYQELIEKETAWSFLVHPETIQKMDPDTLLISTYSALDIEKMPWLTSLSAWKNSRIFLLDRSLQDFPSPQSLLAYFDLYDALQKT